MICFSFLFFPACVQFIVMVHHWPLGFKFLSGLILINKLHNSFQDIFLEIIRKFLCCNIKPYHISLLHKYVWSFFPFFFVQTNCNVTQRTQSRNKSYINPWSHWMKYMWPEFLWSLMNIHKMSLHIFHIYIYSYYIISQSNKCKKIKMTSTHAHAHTHSSHADSGITTILVFSLSSCSSSGKGSYCRLYSSRVTRVMMNISRINSCWLITVVQRIQGVELVRKEQN